MVVLKIDGEKCEKVIDSMIEKHFKLDQIKGKNVVKNKLKTRKSIKINDYVLVIGEGNEVFQVVGSTDKAIFLSTGIAEPREKCTRIPKEFHNKLNSTSHTYLDFDSIDQIMEERRGK